MSNSEPKVEEKGMAEQVTEILDFSLPPGLKKKDADADSEKSKEGPSENGEEKASDEKKVEPEKGEAEKKEEVDPRDTTIMELTKKVDELTKLVGAGSEKEPEPEPEFKPEELVTVAEVEEAQYDTAKMSALFNKVFNAGRENTLKAIPALVTTTVSRQSAITNLVQGFWEKNADLKDDRDYVSYVTTQVEGEHPDWTLADVLTEVEKRVRSGKAFRKQAESIESDRKDGSEGDEEDDPAFPKKPRGNDSRRKGADTRSDLQKSIDDLISKK